MIQGPIKRTADRIAAWQRSHNGRPMHEITIVKIFVDMLRRLLRLALAHHKLVYEQKNNHDSNSTSTNRK